jgi:hypothetical protein
VIRYETIVGTGGGALSALVPNAGLLGEPLDSKNVNPFYDRGVIRDLSERLLESDGAYWSFYSPREVENVAARMMTNKLPYERGYADAGAGGEPNPLVGPEDGVSSVSEELDYYAGYAAALSDLQAGHHDPAGIALERGGDERP